MTNHRKYRFFYHYNKYLEGMTVHFKGVCHKVEDISCQVPCETKWNKTQPYIVMQGLAKKVSINKAGRATIT